MYCPSRIASLFALSITTAALISSTAPSYAAPNSNTDKVLVVQIPKADPNQERFIQSAPNPQPIPKSASPILPAQSAPSESTPVSSPFFVRKIDILGGTVFSPKEFEAITKPLEGHSVTLQELGAAANAITQRYLNAGYITSRAVLANQTVTGGIVRMQILEGQLEDIQVEGTQRLKPEYVRDRIQLGVSVPLNTGKLEDQLRLLKADPLFENVEASLKAGTENNQAMLTVRVKEAASFKTALSIDNYSPPSVAPERLAASLRYQNLTGIGDELAASYVAGTNFEDFQRAASNSYDFTYRAPLNAMNGTLQLRAVSSASKVTQAPFDVLGIRSDSELYEISYRQPLVRTPQQELALSLGFTYQNGQTFAFNNIATPFGIGPDTNGRSRTSVIKFGQDYTSRDTQGTWSLQSQFNIGTGLFGATVNEEPIPDSRFFSWQGQIERLQLLGNGNLFIAQSSLQLSGDSLLPSHQFVIGGGQSVRGYRQNARSGDNGFRASVEGRFPVVRNTEGNPTFQLAPFIEGGTVWNTASNPNTLPPETFLASAGLGFLWQPMPNLNLRMDYGIPVVNLKDRGTSLQDNGLYFSLSYTP
jgi:hemolysin activation/secretion protein